jgi:predicted lipid carrier protein YhbT
LFHAGQEAASEIRRLLICLKAFPEPGDSLKRMNAPIMPRPGSRRRSLQPAMPGPIRSLVRRLPRVPSSAVVAAVLNLTLRRGLAADVLERLAERPFTIVVRDMGLVMAFRYSERRFIPVPYQGPAALSFRVDAADFASLAAPEDDPDTRFLHDLVVVGDPEIASSVRETLKGLDVVRTRRLLRRAVRHVGHSRARA